MRVAWLLTVMGAAVFEHASQDGAAVRRGKGCRQSGENGPILDAVLHKGTILQVVHLSITASMLALSYSHSGVISASKTWKRDESIIVARPAAKMSRSGTKLQFNARSKACTSTLSSPSSLLRQPQPNWPCACAVALVVRGRSENRSGARGCSLSNGLESSRKFFPS